MSSFTVGLAVLGGLLLAVLVGWNTWTTRRNTPRQAEGAPVAASAHAWNERARSGVRPEPVAPAAAGDRRRSPAWTR